MVLHRSHGCLRPRPELGSRSGPRSERGSEARWARREDEPTGKARRPPWRRPERGLDASGRAWHPRGDEPARRADCYKWLRSGTPGQRRAVAAAVEQGEGDEVLGRKPKAMR